MPPKEPPRLPQETFLGQYFSLHSLILDQRGLLGMQQWWTRRVYWCGLKNCSVRVDADGAVAAHHDLPLADLARKPRLVTNSSISQRGIAPRASFGHSADSFPPCWAAIPSCGGSLFVMMGVQAGHHATSLSHSSKSRSPPPPRTRSAHPFLGSFDTTFLILSCYM